MDTLVIQRTGDAMAVAVATSPIHGYGLFALEDIQRGRCVLDYRGRRISKSESIDLCSQGNAFVFSMNEEFDLDGNTPSNPARFINHSCAPNCEAQLDTDQVWIVASRDVQVGEEITFNYGFDLEAYRDHPCSCGASTCVGYIVGEQFFEQVRRQTGRNV